MDKLMEEEGLKFIILARLSVIVPFNVSNYVLGSTSVSYADFANGTLYIMAMCAFIVYIGTTVSTIQEAIDGTHPASNIDVAIMIFSIIVAVIGIVWTTVIVKQILDKEYARQE